ncbi:MULTISPECIES: acyl-CoA dehydrogenase family protein [Hydrocarboniphaga]|uniref:Putative acyl-CoA dehydrogenase oxidoreductase n=1 Tax=Hydrocarboniphaga effusa AP103 TaxID=1172194 RepID=I7ZF89_9GAMM|nr:MULTISPECIES: acyl-CoA dehydrogenase family protein [Hydrocarboniphaga]EIT70554.1 Putative acyl-CoA dehydrogenase oxidoreductase [Hydrocarboniphaga effusa AP103]MDZ4077581.1 acyl-CoA dehydrogenase family protein [Hydrocarboniphaga sp.]
MDLNFSADEETFRLEVRQFLARHLPADIRDRQRLGKRYLAEDTIRWQKILHAQGWGAPTWPTAFGGMGWTPVQQYIFDEERAAAGAPGQLPFSFKMLAPVLMAFGSPAQQQYFLPRIMAAEDWWCQGYSEPGSGSDLASLKTTARREGDHYVVNGQKTWTTLGQFANWIFCLVRTNGEVRAQQGISFLLIDMATPGITVRPIVMLDGEHEINEVWFENVRVPVDNLVGEENKGWTYAKFLLGHERTNIAGIGDSKAALRKLKKIASQERAGGRPLIENARFRDRIAQVELELMALEITNLRALCADAHDRASGIQASILKVKGSEIQQAIAELQMQALGPYAVPHLPEALDAQWRADPLMQQAYADYAPALTGHYLNLRKTSIYAGSNEIQKNIIAQLTLGS